ncbi:MAG TPA: HNH endonuclease signature motif containing protein [Geminicoccaceae bacterium]|nr:HNH endonuclease signature motif containing protein [Geminicoccaceae bacterium]
MNAKQPTPIRSQHKARRVLDEHYPFRCCAVCGLALVGCLQVAHLDHDPSNNSPQNLARLCHTHHWMHDVGLYPTEAIRLMQNHWQKTKGQGSHKDRMKDAGAKAAIKRKRSASARKAWATRTLKAERLKVQEALKTEM